MARRLTGLGIAIEGTVAAKPMPSIPAVHLTPDAAGTAAAELFVLVGDPFGRVLGELGADVMGVAWKLNDYGQARFVLPRTSATVTETLLRPGNRVLVQFSNGLPDWGGMLDLPRKWKDGRIDLVAYSGERLFADRVTAAGLYFTNETPGSIFTTLLNEVDISGLSIGEVWTGGDPITIDYHYRTLYDVFARSLAGQVGGGDWSVTAGLAGGQIVFRANYYQRRGVDHGRRLALIEGVNLAETGLQEQGTLINEWVAAGGGTSWESGARIYATARDEASITSYGLRQRGEVRVDISDQDTLNQKVAVALAESKEPRAIVDPVALDLPPARWGQYDVGDTVWMELYEAGFGGYAASVRIKAREFLPGRGVCSLVVE
jgi:hypothetical protein